MPRFETVLEQGEGILRLAPTWVPRAAYVPGRRLKLHPDDIYAYGVARGGIDERWLASTVAADNGPLTTPDEGLSSVVYGDERAPQRALLRDMVADLGARLLGDGLWERYHGWPAFGKFFDNKGALPFHMHQMREHAERVGAQPKPEGYYFPPQFNAYEGDAPYTYFGLQPGTTQAEVRRRLEIWEQGDNHILELSQAFRLAPGTGWFVPAGFLHAPGSLVTYEPQWASDVYAIFQPLVNGVPFDWSQLVNNVPPEHKRDLDYIVSMLDWEANTAGGVKTRFYRPPLPAAPAGETANAGYRELWISYGNPFFAAKELTVLPGRSATLRDAGPYGLIAVQGHGVLGRWPLETPAMLRFGQLSNDEYFVSCDAAQAGVKMANASSVEPLVVLKQFGPHPDAPPAPAP